MTSTNSPARRLKRAAARANQCLVRLNQLLVSVRDLAPQAGIPVENTAELKEAQIHLRMMGEALADFTKKSLDLGPDDLEVYR